MRLDARLAIVEASKHHPHARVANKPVDKRGLLRKPVRKLDLQLEHEKERAEHDAAKGELLMICGGDRSLFDEASADGAPIASSILLHC